MAVVAEATAAVYARDPTHWGSAEVAALFPGFKHVNMRTKGAIIRLRHGSLGPRRCCSCRSSEQSRAVVRGRRAACGTLSRGSSGSARLAERATGKLPPQGG